jgi:transcriptional regulator with XRE-family HTH domain
VREDQVELKEVQARIGQSIAEHRRALDLTQEELAERVGTSPEWVSQVERGVGKPSLDLLLKVADALHVPLAHLLDGGGPQERRSGVLGELLSRAERLPDPALRVLLDTASSMVREFAEKKEG